MIQDADFSFDKFPKGAESFTVPATSVLLNSLNQSFAAITTKQWASLPAPVGGAEVLQGRKVLMVDDSFEVLCAFVPALVATTGMQPSFIYVKPHGQTTEEILKEVQVSSADIILFDMQLGRDRNRDDRFGNDLMDRFNPKAGGAICVGFSMVVNDRFSSLFNQAGAHAIVKKDSNAIDSTILNIALAVERQVEKGWKFRGEAA